jgi:hypothetical protein
MPSRPHAIFTTPLGTPASAVQFRFDFSPAWLPYEKVDVLAEHFAAGADFFSPPAASLVQTTSAERPTYIAMK